ncbi:MAG: hypothetical protein KAH62_05335, partial [Desulfobacula sp.]|nr:hypothetical protein [Desulfobacula sp.]
PLFLYHIRYTGYKGRIAVFEMLILNEFVRDAIHKASSGVTTIEEIFRCVPKLIKPRSIQEIKRLQRN